MIMTAICFSLSVFFAAVFLLLLRTRRNLYCLLAGLLPVIIPLLLNKDARIYAWHNWMQAGIVYQILNGYTPPDNPLFAGHTSLYPWGYPCLLAFISKILDVTPFISSALISVVLLAFLLFISFQISKMISEDRIANLFSVLIPIYAFTFTQNPIFLAFVSRLNNFFSIQIPLHIEESIDILHKFSGDTAYPAGIAFFALFLFGLIRVFGLNRLDSKTLFSLAAGVICLGFLYPFMFLAIYPIVFLIIANDLFKKQFDKSAWIVTLILVLSSLVLYPYFASFTAMKESQARITMASSLSEVVKGGAIIFSTLSPISLFLFLFRRSLKETFAKKKRLCEILFFPVITCSIMFLCLQGPGGTQYKFLALACYCLGIFGGFAFADLYRKRPYICWFVAAIFLWPTSYDVYHKTNGFHPKTKFDFIEEGVNLVLGSSEHEFYEWILKNTNKKDIFVDSTLQIPILGQRRLYIGWDKDQWESGYSMSAKRILQVANGYDVKSLQNRWTLVQLLFDENSSVKKETAQEIIKSMPKCQIYFVTRDISRRDRFLNSDIFNEVFRGGDSSVFVFSNGIEPIRP
jgi:hypothetical protein